MMHPRRAGFGSVLVILSLLLLAACSGGGHGVKTEAAPPAKIPVASLDDLPVHTYPLQGSASAMFADPAQMAALKDAYRADLEADLAKYDIRDEATLQGKYGALALVAMMDGRDQDALAWLDKGGELEDKESARLMNGLVNRALIASRARDRSRTPASSRSWPPAWPPCPGTWCRTPSRAARAAPSS